MMFYTIRFALSGAMPTKCLVCMLLFVREVMIAFAVPICISKVQVTTYTAGCGSAAGHFVLCVCQGTSGIFIPGPYIYMLMIPSSFTCSNEPLDHTEKV